jgi:hypothetical protein
MSVHIINNSKLLDELLNFDSRAGLFTNNINKNNENPSFVEPSFSGYSKFSLSKDSWGPAIQEEDYATISYNDEIYWTNNSSSNIIINGYFLENLNSQKLWFNVFSNPISISQNEGVSVTPKIYLNNLNNLISTFFLFNLVNPNPTPITLNPVISISNETWGGVSATNSLVNTKTGDYTYDASSGALNLALDSKIDPTVALPFSFTITAQQTGFFVATKNVNITNSGVYDLTLYMVEVG